MKTKNDFLEIGALKDFYQGKLSKVEITSKAEVNVAACWDVTWLLPCYVSFSRFLSQTWSSTAKATERW